MFVTNHVLAGVTIGALLGRRPAGAFVAGVVSHFAMDACPHWGLAKGDPAAAERFLHIAKCDGCAGLAAMAVGVAVAGGNARKSTALAMIGAALPDLDKPCLHFFGFNPFPEWFRRLHGNIQTEGPGLFRREVLIGVSLAALAAAAVSRRP